MDDPSNVLKPGTPRRFAAFERLCALEPGLAVLYRDIGMIGGEKDMFCANTLWARYFKPKLVQLVGYEAQNALLQSREAYDLAYATLYELLPPCKNCQCM